MSNTKLFRLLFGKDLFPATLTLLLASAVCVILVFARILIVRNLNYAFLIWNLFLTWLPFTLALIMSNCHSGGQTAARKKVTLFADWLLLFPNALYIFTDLVHLTSRFYLHFLVDMVLILLCALTGLVLGFVSLYIIQSVVADKSGSADSWFFVAGVAVLSGIGVFFGRFLLNSWDMLLRPATVYHRVDNWMAGSDKLTPYIFASILSIFCSSAI